MCCRRCYYHTAEWKQTHLNCSLFENRNRSTAYDYCALRLLCATGTKTCGRGSWISTYISQALARADGTRKSVTPTLCPNMVSMAEAYIGARAWTNSSELLDNFMQHLSLTGQIRLVEFKTYGNAPGTLWKFTLMSALVKEFAALRNTVYLGSEVSVLGRAEHQFRDRHLRSEQTPIVLPSIWKWSLQTRWM